MRNRPPVSIVQKADMTVAARTYGVIFTIRLHTFTGISLVGTLVSVVLQP